LVAPSSEDGFIKVAKKVPALVEEDVLGFDVSVADSFLLEDS
jgi:hypothetical protein